MATFDVTIDPAAPGGTIAADPPVIWWPTRKLITVTLSGEVTDVGTGVESVTFRVIDEYGTVEPSLAPLAGDGRTAVGFTREFQLEAWRRGGDADGRTFTIEAVVTDRACNVTTIRTTVIVPHDQR